MLPTRIKDTLRNFAVNTTLHGINRVSSSKHAIGKLLWACIVLTCVALCFRQIYTLGVQYGSKQVNTKISIRYQKVYFPAVSFCNLNPVSYSKIEEQYSEWNEYSFAAILGYGLYSEHQKIVTEIEKQFDDSTASYGKRKKRDIRGAVEDSHVPNVAIPRTFYKVQLKRTITLECEVTDITPAFVVQWQKVLGNTTMHVTIDSANKYNGSTTSTPSLTIFNAELSDDGVYRCTARNKYGIAESPRIYLKLTVVDLDVDPILRASGEFRLMMSSFGYLGDYEKETEQGIKALSADLSDFVIYCNFEGRQCNESVFVPFFDKYYGMCYRFPPEPITTKRAGPLFALQLILNVNQSDYVPYIASEAGIRLSIHEHGSQPYLENNGISVATGFRTDISLVQKKIERMPGTTVCDASNKFGNINACFEECVEKNVKEKCNCLLTFPNGKTNLYTCTSQDFDCLEDVHENVTGCKCLNPCSEKRHAMTISTTRWPAENYEDLLEKILKNKGLSFSNARNSLLQISIYFSSLYEEVTEEIPSITFESFLSNIGGSFGLWIGMSAISIGELLELCFLLLRSMRRREKVTETQTDVNLNDTVESTILSNDRNTQFAFDKPPVEGKSGISTDSVAFGERKPGPY